MDTSRNIKYYNEMDDEGKFELSGVAARKTSRPKPGKVPLAIQAFVEAQDDSRNAFSFTYQAARFEQSWLLDSLGYFYEQHWISDVLRKIKAGKEASVYLCRSGEMVQAPYVAAKVYRPRMLRNLRNDHVYQEGRPVLDEEGRTVVDVHALHAVIDRSHFGEQVRHQSWIAYEYDALQALHAAGVEVPRPYEKGHNAILMDYLGDETMSAPTLNEVDLEPGEARTLFDRLWVNLDRMLGTGRVHGDLSAYNVLYWGEQIALIDFPQVISPQGNRNAFSFFARDMARLCEYFIHQGLPLEPQRLARQLWTAHGYSVRAEVHPRFLDPEDPGDRQAWNQAERAD